MDYIRHPSPRTLAKYGLRESDYQAILKRQRWVCAVCGTVPDSGTLQIDHEHTLGFGRMSDAEKRKYVRGLLCAFCNHYVVGRHKKPDKLKAAARYLEAFARRKK